jgi:DNA-binding LacI/PurR family transcriptional regulator
MARAGRQSGPPTLAAVARLAGVSTQTVSNALNAPERLQPATLERVLAAVRELDYRPNRAARALRSAKSKLVGLEVRPVPADKAGSLLDRFLHALVERSVGEGYHILLFTPSQPADPLSGFRDLLASTAVDAFVVTDAERGDPRAAWLHARGAPFVTFGRWEAGAAESAGYGWVDVDGAAGTAAAVTHLVERGHRRIGYLGWHAGNDVADERRRGWMEALADHDLSAPELAIEVIDTTSGGAAGAAALLGHPAPPTALVCASDTLAMGVLALCHERGLVPGRDIAITGFDDSPTAAVTPPGLTTVRQPLEDIATAIVVRLRDLLSGTRPRQPGDLLAPSLVVRGTT